MSTNQHIETNESKSTGGFTPPPVTDGEAAAIRERYDKVARSTRKNTGRLHPVDPETGEPLCSHNHGPHGEKRWQRKDWAVYPPGWKPVCRWCALEWRDRGGSA